MLTWWCRQPRGARLQNVKNANAAAGREGQAASAKPDHSTIWRRAGRRRQAQSDWAVVVVHAGGAAEHTSFTQRQDQEPSKHRPSRAHSLRAAQVSACLSKVVGG